MRTLPIGPSAATLVACSCPPLPRQLSMLGCSDGNGPTCLDGMAANQPTEQEPTPLNANATTANTKIAVKARRRSSAHGRDRAHAATDTAKPTVVAARSEPPAAANSEPSASPSRRKRPMQSSPRRR